MHRKLGLRFLVIGVFILLVLWYVFPTIRWASLDTSEREALKQEYKRFDEEHSTPSFLKASEISLSRWYRGDKSKVVNLGLDLQGGTHLVLQVDSNAAITNEMVRLKENLRKHFLDDHILVGSMTTEDRKIIIPLTVTAKGDVEESIRQYSADLTIDYAQDRLLVSMPPERFSYLRTSSVKQALETIRNRVDEFGVAEPIIQPEGEDRILVQLPGIEDPERVISLLGRTAQLSFHIVLEGPSPEFEILSRHNHRLPYDTILLPLSGDDAAKGRGLYYLLEKEARITGADLVDARMGRDQLGSPAVDFQLSRAGGTVFGRLTEANLYKQLAIVLDNEVKSAPSIRSRITSDGQITGRFTAQEAEDLAIVLRSGALPAPVQVIEERTVGPTLGIESIRYGLRAALISFAVVAAFMIVYYRVAGAIADVALLLNIASLIAFLACVRATLTLPGIAGIVLTIGMAVDANVLVFERIREEFQKGKSIRSAIDTGYSKAFLPIFDGNLTTLITAAILFQFGSGPIKGFAVTLSVGLLISMFTALFVTRTMFDVLTRRRWLARVNMMRLFEKTNFDFVSMRYVSLIASFVAIVAGMIVFIARGDSNLGVDFVPGTLVQVRFDEPVTSQDVRTALSRGGIGESVVQQYGSARDVLIRANVKTDNSHADENSANESSTGREIVNTLRANTKTPFTVERTEEVGAVVSAELRNKALLAIVYSAIGILVYVAFRFEFRFGVGGVIALFHDVLITMGALALTRRQIQLPVVAALLTIFGYSINDTIVVFDRIRENMKLRRGQDLIKIINASVNETLSRTIITSLTVLFCVAVLYLVGNEVTRDFAFALFVGIVTGTYSSIFIATPVVVIWQSFRERKHALREPTPANRQNLSKA